LHAATRFQGYFAARGFGAAWRQAVSSAASTALRLAPASLIFVLPRHGCKATLKRLLYNGGNRPVSSWDSGLGRWFRS
jgi:hypothetical protein